MGKSEVRVEEFSMSLRDDRPVFLNQCFRPRLDFGPWTSDTGPRTSPPANGICV